MLNQSAIDTAAVARIAELKALRLASNAPASDAPEPGLNGPAIIERAIANGETPAQALDTAANVIAANTADVAKRAKPSKPRKPAAAKPVNVPAPHASIVDRERAQANRAFVKPLYSGASPVSHASIPPKLAEALSRVAHPVQIAKSATTRDESALLLGYKHANAAGTFCPVQSTSDIGALSRCSSLGFLRVAGNRIAFTKRGAERVAVLLKRETSIAAALASAKALTAKPKA